MSYTSQRQKVTESNNQSSSQILKDYEKSALGSTGYIDIERYKDIALNFLFEDLTQAQTDFNFKIVLGNSNYFNSNNFAFSCLDISLYSRDIYNNRISSWTKNALHCFDVLLIYYISNILNEKVPILTVQEKETDVYNHLINKGGDYSDIGTKFKSIYQLRSSFEHIHYTDNDGKRQIRQLSNKKLLEAKQIILKFFKESLTMLLTYYKTSNSVKGNK